MKITTVIFDMDGLLIDSEPLWYEAANEALRNHGVSISPEAYVTTTGLRTKEFLQHWMGLFNIDSSNADQLEDDINKSVIQKVLTKVEIMPGVQHAIDLVVSLGMNIGLASSSPQSLIDAMLIRTGFHGIFKATTSAEFLAYGKPHPQVFITCAEALNVSPEECICIEDSFNGLIAAKASKMKCIVVPHHEQYLQLRWNAADIKLKSLLELKTEHFIQ